MTTRDDDPHGISSPDGPERDAWLSAALRHAPDANSAPPADLSAAILRQARQAVSNTVDSTVSSTVKAATAEPSNRLIRWWSWLARPPIAAGFATLMVATVVSLMWWDRPLEETLRSRAAPSSAVTADTAAVPAASAVSGAAAPETEASREEASPQAAPHVPAPGAATKSVASAPRPAPRQRAAEDRDEAARTSRSLDAASPAAAAAPAPERAPAPAPGPAQAQAHAQAQAQGLARAPAQAQIPAPNAPPAAPSAFAKSGQDAAAEASAAAPPAPAPARLAERRDAERGPLPVIDDAEHWTWQRSAGPQPMTAALEAWLAQLALNAHWQTATNPPPAAAPALTLARDGAPKATLSLGDDAVWLTRPGAPALMAPLAPATAAALKTALEAAAR